MGRRENLNIIRFVLEPSVASVLSCFVRSFFFVLSLLSSSKQAGHGWSSRSVIEIVSPCIPLFAGHRHDLPCDFFLLLEKELLHNVQVVVVHTIVTQIFNKALVHFVQLHHVHGRSCERLWTTIKRHIECRVARACDHSQSGRSWYGHALNAPLGSFNLRLLVRWRALRPLAFMVRVVFPEWSSIKRA